MKKKMLGPRCEERDGANLYSNLSTLVYVEGGEP